MIKTGIRRLRDPFLIKKDGAYYIYGTDVTGGWDTESVWRCFKNDSGSLYGEWKKLENIAEIPSDAIKNRWAPEVHLYKGAYYMLTTYFSQKKGHRGCTVLKADTPDGPFKEVSDGTITPDGWDAIDGTLYVDEQGQPWLVFVHEWVCTDDGIGRMCVAKMSDDLTKLTSNPIEIFRADDPSWAKNNITDGCFMYKTADGELLMIWSNFDKDGYCVGIARSDNGKVDGVWSHDEKLLYSKEIDGTNDGGHGMIFKDGGEMYLIIHSPNTPTDGETEQVIILPIVEKNGSLELK